MAKIPILPNGFVLGACLDDYLRLEYGAGLTFHKTPGVREPLPLDVMHQLMDDV
jgi:hypothetical protein